MHYRNGRAAANGDKVALFTATRWDAEGKPIAHVVTVGILYDAAEGNDHCNGRVAPISSSDPTPDLKSCLHLDDLLALAPQLDAVPDTSRK